MYTNNGIGFDAIGCPSAESSASHARSIDARDEFILSDALAEPRVFIVSMLRVRVVDRNGSDVVSRVPHSATSGNENHRAAEAAEK